MLENFSLPYACEYAPLSNILLKYFSVQYVVFLYELNI